MFAQTTLRYICLTGEVVTVLFSSFDYVNVAIESSNSSVVERQITKEYFFDALISGRLTPYND